MVCTRGRRAGRLIVPVWLLGLFLSLFLPYTGQASPIEEWERLDKESGAEAASIKIEPGRPWTEPMSGMSLLWVPGGCFKMGSAPSAEGRDADEGPVRPVCVSGLWLGEKEVTQQQWQNIMQQNPATFRKDKAFPVETISRMDVDTFISKINVFYRGRVRFRLPTEAEWEYACRNAGQRVTYPGYDQIDQLSWYRVNSQGSSQITGTRAPNRLGLLDMSGNVWEWVQDTYDSAAYGQPGHIARQPINNPVFTGLAPFSVVRGGGWDDAQRTLRCANRGFESLSHKRSNLGVRLAADLDLVKKERNVEERATEMPF